MNLFYTSIHTDRQATFNLALIDSCTCAQTKGMGARFAVDTKHNVPTNLDKATTGNSRRELETKGQTHINGVTFSLQTHRTQKSLDPVVFAPYVTLNLLDKLAADLRVSDIYYVPHSQPELDAVLLKYPGATKLF